mgnify:CR=1 FL=1
MSPVRLVLAQLHSIKNVAVKLQLPQKVTLVTAFACVSRTAKQELSALLSPRGHYSNHELCTLRAQRQGKHLRNMVLKHISHHTVVVVEARSACHIHRLRHGYFHTRNAPGWMCWVVRIKVEIGVGLVSVSRPVGPQRCGLLDVCVAKSCDAVHGVLAQVVVNQEHVVGVHNTCKLRMYRVVSHNGMRLVSGLRCKRCAHPQHSAIHTSCASSRAESRSRPKGFSRTTRNVTGGLGRHIWLMAETAPTNARGVIAKKNVRPTSRVFSPRPQAPMNVSIAAYLAMQDNIPFQSGNHVCDVTTTTRCNTRHSLGAHSYCHTLHWTAHWRSLCVQ